MSNGSLSSALRQFIAQHIRSVEQIEVLCLLSTEPEKAWTVDEVFRAIQSTRKSIAVCLEEFSQRGLLASQRAETYRLSPETPELTQRVAELTAAYRERRVAIIQTIYGKPSEAVQGFADAFNLKKRK